MNKLSFIAFIVSLTFSDFGYSQIKTGVVVLNPQEQERFKRLIAENPEIASLSDSLKTMADVHLKANPKPIKQIYYEGLLDQNLKRVESVESLLDMNKIADLIYTAYGSSKNKYKEKIKDIVLAWADTYVPSGNTINENKLIPAFWGYFIHRGSFNKNEKQTVESWMLSIALKELQRENTPNNNWQSKRLKIIGTVGCILDNSELKQFAIAGVKDYISTAYYPDGTSNDLKSRDALSYHCSGIEPLLEIFINLRKFDSMFDQYQYTDSLGTSVQKAIEYMVPYLSGEKTRKEWINTTVDLDKERAKAGLEKYQPGILYDPKDAIPMLIWAVYYNPELVEYICGCNKCFTCNVEALLNSPLVRERNE